MSSGLLKFSNRITATNGDKLHWGRVDADGLPFRGPITPTYREDEWESRTVKVADARNGFFDVHDVVSNKQYLDVLECCANGWFQLVYLERFWTDPNGNRTSLHYVFVSAVRERTHAGQVRYGTDNLIALFNQLSRTLIVKLPRTFHATC